MSEDEERTVSAELAKDDPGVEVTTSGKSAAPAFIAERSFDDVMGVLDRAAATGSSSPELGIDVAEYKGTFDEDGNEMPRPTEDTDFQGWTAQSGVRSADWMRKRRAVTSCDSSSGTGNSE